MMNIEIKKQEVIITKYESAKKETNTMMIENNGHEQETFYFLSGQEGLHRRGHISSGSQQVDLRPLIQEQGR